MGTYLGVNAVKEHGEQINADDKQPRIPPGKFLVAIICNGIWSIAPEVTPESEYDEFHRDYCAGHWLSFKVYAVNESDRDNCPDEGRVPCGGF